MDYNETPTKGIEMPNDFRRTRAIELTPVNFDTIVKDTPFTIETLTALYTSSPYLLVVQDGVMPEGAFMIMTHRNVVTFGFPDTTRYWFDCILYAR